MHITSLEPLVQNHYFSLSLTLSLSNTISPAPSLAILLFYYHNDSTTTIISPSPSIIRVSSDAGQTWLPEFPLPKTDRWNLPCARNMVRNSITRMAFHGRWWVSDPDCLLLRTNTWFTGWNSLWFGQGWASQSIPMLFLLFEHIYIYIHLFPLFPY